MVFVPTASESTPYYDVVFYFGDPPERKSLYQLRQWIQPLERLSAHCSVAVVTASLEAAELVASTKLSGFNYSDMNASVQLLDDLKPRIVLYPNQFFENFKVWAYLDALHVFVSHGESDKTYMSQNSLQYFDYVYTAGNVAINRIREHVPGFSLIRCIGVGRPQLFDIQETGPEQFQNSDGRKTILYAPTWEGGLPQNRYGSVQSHGLNIVKSILANDKKFRLIYKPHPFTGSIIPEAVEANREIANAVLAAGNGHLVDQSPFGWHLKLADLMITDVSAVAYDWLSTGKPILITKPEEPSAELYQGGILGALDLVSKEDAGSIASRIDASFSDPEAINLINHWSREYYDSALIEKTGKERFIERTLELLAKAPNRNNAATSKASPQSQPLKARVISTIRRAIPLGLKLRISRAFSQLFNSGIPSVNRILVNLSNSPISIELVRKASKGAKTLLLVDNLKNFAKAVLAGEKNLKVRIVQSAQDLVAIVDEQQPEEILYLAHCASNHFGIRLNGIRHVLFMPELQAGFRLDHNLIAYNEIETSDKALKSAIEEKVTRPEGWNITLV